MIERWTCARCGTRNEPSAIGCASCGLMRGSVALPPTAADPASDGSSAPHQAAGSTSATDPEMPAPAGSRSLLGRLPLGWIVGLGVVAVIGIGGVLFSAGRSDSGEIDRAGDLAASDLRAGDCFDLKDADADEVDDVRAVPCDEAHEFEMVFVGDVPGDAYPTDADAVFEQYVVDECLPAWEAFVGLPYEDSVLDIFYFTPTTGSWSDGDHSIQCAVYDPRDAALTGSLQGAAR